MFCVECGKDTDELINGACLDCYLCDKTFFNPPPAITLLVCRECGAVRIGKQWHLVSPETELDQHIQRAMACDTLNQQQFIINRDDNTIACSGMFKGRLIREVHPLTVRQRASLCNECAKARGGYFEAIIQVRKQGGAMTKKERELADDLVSKEAAVDRRNHLSRRELCHGGIDYYLGDKGRASAIARCLADVFDATIETSFSLAGMQNGREIHRNTILVRLPSYQKGDFVELDDVVFQVAETGKRVTLRNLANGAYCHVYRSEMANTTVLPIKQQDAVVVSLDTHEVQILDPETYDTVTLSAPQSSIIGDTISIVKWKGVLYLVGD